MVGSGGFREEILDEKNEKKMFVYDLDKLVKMDNIGIVVGKFVTN